MNDLLKDFKIQPTKLRGENMEKEIQILTRYEDPTIKQLQQELTNLKAIEKQHQRMNGELREENKQLKENVNNAIERLEALIIFWKKYNPIDNTMQVGQFEGVIEMLKGGNDEK